MEFPDGVRNEMGHALYIAQKVEKHRDAKPFKDFRDGFVLETVQSDARGTYRTVYAVQMEKSCYYSLCFSKKIKGGHQNSKARN
ncbi:type II toxin-antitoxin system RelE/ParE family toxin [Neochlamydia sp. AcF95]|uniref:type II toxin-antitoxin system RelE/ParE family toxin n=1 Tax=Neochlamydia sp. AcF95 TaxID=2795734 RepID=UPI001BCA2985|nr:type II toxin-antitoxin system RelE/ParE family toxin [Neochlamydia sp. AcF95]